MGQFPPVRIQAQKTSFCIWTYLQLQLKPKLSMVLFFFFFLIPAFWCLEFQLKKLKKHWNQAFYVFEPNLEVLNFRFFPQRLSLCFSPQVSWLTFLQVQMTPILSGRRMDRKWRHASLNRLTGCLMAECMSSVGWKIQYQEIQNINVHSSQRLGTQHQKCSSKWKIQVGWFWLYALFVGSANKGFADTENCFFLTLPWN